MEKLKMDQYLFHGIEPWDNLLSSRTIGSIKIFEKILNTGFLASRELLKEILSEEEYKLFHMSREVNWNRNIYVSIVPTLHPEIEGIHSVLEDYVCLPEDAIEFAYNFYVKRYPSIILDSKLLKELEANKEQGPVCIGEIQIRDNIPSNYFIGVSLPGIPKINSFLVYMELWNPLNDEIPNVEYKPWYEEAKWDFYQLTAEEFIDRYYEVVLSFEDVLRRTNSNLKLYHADTGIQVQSSAEVVDQVEQLKKKSFKSLTYDKLGNRFML